MKKIIIIGKKSFIGQNLYSLLKNKLHISKISFEKFINLKNLPLDIDYIINCSIHKDYTNKTYKKKSDLDYQIALKIKKLNTKLILLSSRKVYKSEDNLKENSKLSMNSSYSKNKIITEKKIAKTLVNRVLILRISNLIGIKKNYRFETNYSRKIHKTFIDYFFYNIKKGIIFNNHKKYKDFLSIKKFSEIVLKLIFKNTVGSFNVSMGKRVYLSKLINWLNYYNTKNFVCIDLTSKYDKDCFYLNNDKLKKSINVRISLKELEKYCKEVSKKFFKK